LQQLRELGGAERLQNRRRRDQPEWLVRVLGASAENRLLIAIP
jgi:hypothetical protein